MRNIDQIIDEIIQREGGYVDHPKDKGGATKFGITERVARQHGYQGDMKDLPRSLAHMILTKTYFIKPGFDDVAMVSESLAVILTDAGVLCGPPTVSKWLQRILNVLNREGRLYKDIIADGLIGHNTMAALDALVDHRGQEGVEVISRAFNCLLGEHFISISENRPANKEFIYGWLLKRISID